MKTLRSARLLMLAFLLCLVPATSFAGVFISVGFAPPVLPVYEQPPCPEDGFMWTPGYWAYGDEGYYWVPGAWVPAPQPGFLWTPGYWGFEGGNYLFHGGYWGAHVGYYGGVNYGFGYMGMGFAGGEWRGDRFAYNTAVVRVNTTVIHNTYVNETIVHNTTIINNNRVAYTGGPGGIRHEPTPEERQFSSERHVAPTAIQTRHIQAAAQDPQQRFNTNHGRPATVAAARPLAAPAHTAPVNRGAMTPARPDTRMTPSARPETRPTPTARPETTRPAPTMRPETTRPAPTMRPETTRPAPTERPESRPAPTMRPESRPAPEARPESRPAPQARPESRPESRPAPAPRPESRPAPRPSNEKPEHEHGR